MDEKTQSARVLWALAYGWCSALTFVRFKRPILCWTKRISELRERGHKIEKRWNHKGFWEYRLVK